MNESPITKLPDGSGCFTATILSKSEAMALPLKERPICYRISEVIYNSVFESIGTASMCWVPIPTGVFHSEKASDVAVQLCLKIADDQDKIQERLSKLKNALEKISKFDEESIWDDDRDDAANAILEIAREALK